MKIFGGRFHPTNFFEQNFSAYDPQGTKNAPRPVEHEKFRLLKFRYMGPLKHLLFGLMSYDVYLFAFNTLFEN